MNNATGRGRRSGASSTKDTIRAAARTRFLEDGYTGVTMRSIAAAAGVDVALVSYWFGSKKGLFAAAMDLTVSPADVLERALDGDDSGLAERVLRSLVTTWDGAGGGAPLRSVVSAAVTDATVCRLVSEAIEHQLIDPLAARIGGPDARGRAAAFCTGVGGVVFWRYVLRIEPLASMPLETIVRRLAPGLQLVLDLPD
jgi:AcrR family transcriptional regulator